MAAGRAEDGELIEGEAVSPHTGSNQSTSSWGRQWTSEEWERWYRSDQPWWGWAMTNYPRSNGSGWDRGSDFDDRDRGGGTDKITVPDFNAEDDRDGVRARGYLRKIEAWRT